MNSIRLLCLIKEYNGSTICNSDCQESKKAIQKLFVKAEVLSGLYRVKLGSLLRQISSQIGITSSNERISYFINDDWNQCKEINDIETLIFETMKKVALQYGLEASLKDIPNVFGYVDVASIKKSFYPMYSLCNAGNIYLSRLVKSIWQLLYPVECNPKVLTCKIRLNSNLIDRSRVNWVIIIYHH